MLAATVATTVIGGIWYTALFGRSYAASLGRVHDLKAKPAPIFIFGPMVCSFLTTVTSAVLIKALSISSLSAAILFGAVVGVGYMVATMANTAINPNMPRPLAYSLISGPFFLLTSIVTAAILVALP